MLWPVVWIVPFVPTMSVPAKRQLFRSFCGAVSKTGPSSSSIPSVVPLYQRIVIGGNSARAGISQATVSHRGKESRFTRDAWAVTLNVAVVVPGSASQRSWTFRAMKPKLAECEAQLPN